MAGHDPPNPDFSDDSPSRFSGWAGLRLPAILIVGLTGIVAGGVGLAGSVFRSVAGSDPDRARRGSAGELGAIRRWTDREKTTVAGAEEDPTGVVFGALVSSGRSAIAAQCAVRSAETEAEGAKAAAHLWAALAAEAIHQSAIADAHEAEAARIGQVPPHIPKQAVNDVILFGYTPARQALN